MAITRRAWLCAFSAVLAGARLAQAQPRQAQVVVLFPGDAEDDEPAARAFFDEMRRLESSQPRGQPGLFLNRALELRGGQPATEAHLLQNICLPLPSPVGMEPRVQAGGALWQSGQQRALCRREVR